jgi:nicotinamide riboside kinase
LVTGTCSTGKMTLAIELDRRFNLPFITEQAWEVAKG